MHIELLWLIPVLAFALLIFIIAYYAQRRGEPDKNELIKEVALFNAGRSEPRKPEASVAEHDRIGELEKTISSVAESLAHQQKSLQEYHNDSNTSSAEIGELKEKLRNVFKEYDIVLSENYALRAKVKQLMKQTQDGESPGKDSVPVEPILTRPAEKLPPPSTMPLEDTRLFNIASLNEFFKDEQSKKSF